MARWRGPEFGRLARWGFAAAPRWLLATLMLWLATASIQAEASLTVGSKKFTESVILGELVTGLLRSQGSRAVHHRELGGTRVLWNALLRGDIDMYPDYTGTLRHEILAGEQVGQGMAGLTAALAERGVRLSSPLGFNNGYALGLLRPRFEQLGIRTISELRRHPTLVIGTSNEFLRRADGWPALQQAYALPQRVRGMDHDLAYRGLQAGDLDLMTLYTTDAEIARHDVVALVDDRGFFPPYQAVLVYRADLDPQTVQGIERLAGQIDEADMIGMNAAVKIDGHAESAVADDFLRQRLDIERVSELPQGRWARIGQRTREHLVLVSVSLSAAILVALPLGIWAARRPRLAQLILGIAGVLQTLPALALLVFMIPLLGIGAGPAIAALFLYSLLPIVRNTHTGLAGIPPALRESAEALGLPPGARLRLVELPLAAPTILAGIKTAAVINIGTATLGALIGAGGYGQPILTGIRLDDPGLILEGAIPAAVMALAAQGLLDAGERRLRRPARRARRP